MNLRKTPFEIGDRVAVCRNNIEPEPQDAGTVMAREGARYVVRWPDGTLSVHRMGGLQYVPEVTEIYLRANALRLHWDAARERTANCYLPESPEIPEWRDAPTGSLQEIW